MKQCTFYKPLEKGIVQCTACKQYCKVGKDKFGICGIRKNINGKLYSIVYSKPSGLHLDPIEKKPLYHYYPGTKTMSLGFFGCNFKCEFCQNSSISCAKGPTLEKMAKNLKTISPSDFVKAAKDSGARSIASTYNEPAISVEYSLEAFKIAKEEDLGTVFVSNGYSSNETINELKGKLDAINIDLKSFNESFYKKVCGARLNNVLNTIKEFHKTKVWVELTTLVIPGKNDSDEELHEIASFIADLDKNIPWHLIAFFPTHKMTDVSHAQKEDIERAQAAGEEAGLNYIYSALPGKENTYCPKCKKPVIKRSIYNADTLELKGKCSCGKKIRGVFE